MKKSKGFTLVELMVVIVIIGILAALAIPRFLGATNKSKATEFKPILKQIYTLQEAYRQEHDSYGKLTDIAFDQPSTAARFSYQEPTAGTAPAVVTTAGAGDLAHAIPAGPGLKIKTTDGTALTSGDYAWVDDQGVEFAATANLGGLASITVKAAP